MHSFGRFMPAYNVCLVILSSVFFIFSIFSLFFSGCLILVKTRIWCSTRFFVVCFFNCRFYFSQHSYPMRRKIILHLSLRWLFRRGGHQVFLISTAIINILNDRWKTKKKNQIDFVEKWQKIDQKSILLAKFSSARLNFMWASTIEWFEWFVNLITCPPKKLLKFLDQNILTFEHFRAIFRSIFSCLSWACASYAHNSYYARWFSVPIFRLRNQFLFLSFPFPGFLYIAATTGSKANPMPFFPVTLVVLILHWSIVTYITCVYAF